MHYRRLLITIALAAVAVPAYGHKRLPQPTASELATVWVGWADPLHYFRLQLTEDGTGLCGLYESIRSSTRLYEVTEWTLDGYDIEVTLEPIDPDAWPVTMKGTATRQWLYLKLGDGRRHGWRTKATLEPESLIESAMGSAKKRMQDYRRPEDP